MRQRGGTTRLSLAVLAFAGLAATAGHAQELPEKAREALQRGNEALQQRQWLVAGQQFKIATDAAENSPEVMLANAQYSEQKGGSDLVAVAWYRAYLAMLTDAKERDQIKARIDALEQRANRTAHGLIDKAMSAASNVPANDRANALIRIAEAQAKVGDLSGALATASSARNALGANYYGDDPYGTVANALASVGNLTATEDVLRRVEQSKRSSAFRQISWTLTTAKRYPEALSFASRASGTDQVSAYSSIAKYQADAGDKTGAHTSLASAISAASYVQQNDRRGTLTGLVEAAADVGEFDNARRIFADVSKLYNPNDKWDAYNLNTTRWHIAEGLAKWDRSAEAEAMLPTVFPNNKDPSVAWYRTSLIRDIHAAREREGEKLRLKYAALVKDGKLAEADAALSREPPTLPMAPARLELVSAYIAKGDFAAAHRHLDPAAAAVAKAAVADYMGPYFFANSRIAIADDYRIVGDFAASKRVLDATAATIAKLPKADDRRDPIRYLCNAYARLAAAIAATKNYPAAKAVALEVVRLGAIGTSADRADALERVADLDPQIGLSAEFEAALPSLPSGSDKQKIIAALLKQDIAQGRDAAAVARAAQIEDVTKRKSVLSDLIAKRTAEKNWTAALTLANDPAVGGRLYPEIASKLLSANLLQDALALEPKFTAASDEANGFYASLATYYGGRGNVDAAFAAAMRIGNPVRRTGALFSLVYWLNSSLGRAAARSAFERGVAQFAEIKSPGDQADACNAVDYQLRLGNFVEDEAPAKADAPVPVPVCITESLAIPSQSERISALRRAISYHYPTTRILTRPLAPERPSIGRLLAETSAASSGYSRDSDLSTGLNALAKDGAIEMALGLAAAVLEDVDGSGTANTAVTWLAAAGDTTTAKRIVDDASAAIAEVADPSKKDTARSRAVALALVLEDYDRAIKLAAEIASAGDRTSSFVNIANTANANNRFDVALNALDRAVAADQASDSHSSRSSFYSIAGQAGHKNFESYLSDYLADKSVSAYYRLGARDNAITWLLNWKQNDRAAALVPAQEAEIAAQPPTDRWSYRTLSFATSLARLGDTARLNKLFADAPLPENKAQILLSAVNGFVKADKPDVARPAIDRALELSASIADPTTRSTTLQTIASDQALIGNVDAARKLYAQSQDVLKLKRSDMQGWIESSIASAIDSADPDQATRLAQAIADPFWRISTLVRLAANRVTAKKLPDAINLLRALPPSALADSQLDTLSRTLAGKHDFDTARQLAERISHPGQRDLARRYLVLAEARSGAVEAAFADATTIADKAARAYTFVDLGAYLAAQRGDDAAQSVYFGQLGLFAATRLTDKIADAWTKADILAEAGQAQNRWQQGSGTPTLARAATAAGEIADATTRKYAAQWAKGLEAVKRPDPVATEERNKFVYFAKYTLSDDKYQDLDAHLESFATNNPSDRMSKLIYIATSFPEQIQEMHKLAAEFDGKRKSSSK